MRLTDQTRRFITLLIFFLLGPLLTLGILVGIVLRKLPHNARQLEQRFSLQTGLDWSVESVEYRSPTCVRIKKVRLRDPVSAKPVFFAPEIDLTYHTEGRQEDYFPGIERQTLLPKESLPSSVYGLIPKTGRGNGFLSIFVPKSSVRLSHTTSEGASQLVQDYFHRFLARMSALSTQPVRIVLDEVEIVPPVLKAENEMLPNQKSNPLSVRFVAGNLYKTPENVRSSWSFQIPLVSETETQRFQIEQNRKTNISAISFKTERQPIPCELAAMFCSNFHQFGPGSLFSGEISGRQYPAEPHRWSIQLRNAFFNKLDLARFALNYTPLTVNGTVDMNIAKASFGLEPLAAEGWLRVQNGSVDRALFLRLVERFALQVNPSGLLDVGLETYPFDDCMINFRLQSDGVVFWSGDDRNVFMTRNGDGMKKHSMAVYFSQRNTKPISYHSILSIFAPDSAPVVPLTPGIQKLVSMIPTDSFSNPVPRPDLQRKRPETPERSNQELIATTPGSTDILMQNAQQKFAGNRPNNILPEKQPTPAVAAPIFADQWSDTKQLTPLPNPNPINPTQTTNQRSPSDSGPAQLFRPNEPKPSIYENFRSR